MLPSYLQLRWNPPIQMQFTIIDRETHREKKFIKIEKTDVKTKTKKYRTTEIKKKRTTGGWGVVKCVLYSSSRSPSLTQENLMGKLGTHGAEP